MTIQHGGGARPLGRRHRRRSRASASPATTARSRSRPSRRRATFQYTNPTAGLANSGGGTIDVHLAVPGPDRRQRLGRDRRQRPAVQRRRTCTTAINGDRRLRRHGRRSPAPRRPASRSPTAAPRRASTCRTSSSSNLSCGGCFASVEETNHGGANDSFTLNYDGNCPAPIVNGTNYTAAGILAALDADPAGGRDRDGRRLRRRQRSTTPASRSRSRRHAGRDERARCCSQRRRTSPPARPASSARPTRAAPVDNKGDAHADGQPRSRSSRRPRSTRSRCGRRSPSRAARPTRTATRSYYSWEQNDRGAASGHRRC